MTENTKPTKGAKKKKCDCLEVIRKRLEDHHKAPVSLDLKMYVNTKTFSMGSDLPPLNYSYMIGKKRKRSYVTFNFCPFCGAPRK